MGFFNKLFNPKIETVTVSVKHEDTKNINIPPIYIYKTALEKSNEPVSENQQFWIDRYDKKVCPYCGSILVEAPKGERKCKDCGEKMLVRSHFQKKDKKVLLRNDEKEQFESAKKQYFDERWCVRELAFINVSEKQYLKTKQELGNNFSSFDVMKVLIDRTTLHPCGDENSIARHLNFERTRLLLYKGNFDRRGFTDSAYDVLLHLILRDIYFPISKEHPYVIVPGFATDLLSYKEKLNLSVQVIKEDFRKTNEASYGNIKNKINMKRLEKELDSCLSKN